MVVVVEVVVVVVEAVVVVVVAVVLVMVVVVVAVVTVVVVVVLTVVDVVVVGVVVVAWKHSQYFCTPGAGSSPPNAFVLHSVDPRTGLFLDHWVPAP